MTPQNTESPRLRIVGGDEAGRAPCPSCETRNAPDVLRCAYCRAWLVPAARCYACGGTFFTRVERCSSCGADLPEAQPLSPLSLETQRARARSRGWIVAAVVATFAAGIATAFLMGRVDLMGAIALAVFLATLAGGIALLVWDTSIGLYQALPSTDWGSRNAPKDVGTWTMHGRRDDGSHPPRA